MRQMMRYIALTATLLLVGIGTVTHGQGTCLLPGCLDASFGNSGMASTPLLTGGVKAMAVQTINGQDLIVATSAVNWTIARFLPSGSLDTNFGASGIITRTFRKGYAWADQVVVQPDGKIVVLGRLPIGPVVAGTPSSTLVVIRYQSDGKSYDQTFGTGGTVIINPPGVLPFRSDLSLALQSDGKILVAAAADADRDPYTAPFADLHLARLDSAGKFDNTFGPNPQDAFASFPDAGKPTSMVVQRVPVSENVFEERIVLSTATQVGYGSDAPLLSVTSVRRLTSSGLPDTTFANAGVAQMAIPSAEITTFKSIAVDSRNRIVAAGSFYPDASASSSRMLMARYLENGSLDPSFGTLGTLRQDWLDAYFLDMVIQPDGRILANDSKSPGTWRFLENGWLDPDFGQGGFATRPVAGWGGIVLVRTPGTPETPGGRSAFVVGDVTTVGSGRKTTNLCALWRYFY